MKQYLLMALWAILFAGASAQTWVSGSLSFYNTSHDLDSQGNSQSIISQKSLSTSLSPTVGYDFNERWALGVSLAFNYALSEGKSDNVEMFNNRSNMIYLSPFVRCYLAETEGLRFFVDGGVGFGRRHYFERDENDNVFKAYVTPGLSYAINPHFSLLGNFGGFSWIQSRSNGQANEKQWSFTLFDQISLGILFKL